MATAKCSALGCRYVMDLPCFDVGLGTYFSFEGQTNVNDISPTIQMKIKLSMAPRDDFILCK
jgi:hypothetical protein